MQEEPVFYTPEMQQEVREYVRQLEIELGESLPTNEREPEDLRDEREMARLPEKLPFCLIKPLFVIFRRITAMFLLGHSFQKGR